MSCSEGTDLEAEAKIGERIDHFEVMRHSFTRSVSRCIELMEALRVLVQVVCNSWVGSSLTCLRTVLIQTS
jgi:hypothetical protein